MADNIDSMKGYAIAVGALAVITIVTMAVLQGFKDTGLINNTIANKFVTGLTVFATFTTVIVLALVGKIIIGLFKKGD